MQLTYPVSFFKKAALEIAGPELVTVANSLLFNDDDGAFLSRTMTVGNGQKFTWSGWTKRGNITKNVANQHFDLFSVSNGASTSLIFLFSDISDKLAFSSIGGTNLTTTSVYRDSSAWMHVMVAVDTTQSTASDRINLYVNGVLLTDFSTESYPSQNANILTGLTNYRIGTTFLSVGGNTKFLYDGYMAETCFVDGQALAASSFGTFDVNGNWVPVAYTGTFGTNGFHLDYSEIGNVGKDISENVTVKVDTSTMWNPEAAWTITANGSTLISTTITNNSIRTASVVAGDFDFSLTFPAVGDGGKFITIGMFPATSVGLFNPNLVTQIGIASSFTVDLQWFAQSPGNDNYFFGSVSQSSGLIDTAAGDSIIIKRRSGTVSFWLNGALVFTWAQNFTADVYLTVGHHNIAGTHQVDNTSIDVGTFTNEDNFSHSQVAPLSASADSPSNNFCTLNILNKGTSSGTAPTVVFAKGNLRSTVSGAGSDPWGRMVGTIGVSSKKWYWEVVLEANDINGDSIGIAPASIYMPNRSLPGTGATNNLGQFVDEYAYRVDGIKRNNNIITAYGNSFGIGDVISIALDMNLGAIWYAKNGVWQASATEIQIVAGNTTNAAFTGITGVIVPAISHFNSTLSVNFGQQRFSFAPPSGFEAVSVENLPDSPVSDPQEYFNTVAYTGDGLNETHSGVGFKTDLLWIKNRGAINSHILSDSVRGFDANNTPQLSSNDSSVEASGSNVQLVDDDTFRVGPNLNLNSNNYVAWCWKAGGTSSSNTAGSITSQVSANTTSGFSIVTYSGNTTVGATVGHGLGVAPKVIIIKNRNVAEPWVVGHDSTGWIKGFNLNALNAGFELDIYFNDTAPTSSVFELHDHPNTNASPGIYVAYCFAEVDGFSKFGSYDGNTAVDGPFVYCGFKPAWILIKRTTASENWVIYDTVRETYNAMNTTLKPNLITTEGGDANVDIDFLSNGFKIRGTNTNINNGSYIFMAFADQPFKTAVARGVTAFIPEPFAVTSSLIFDTPNDGSYLTKSQASGNTTLWTWSGWIRRGVKQTQKQIRPFIAGDFTGGVDGNFTEIMFNVEGAVDGLISVDHWVNGGPYTAQKTTASFHRDPSAWYHIVVNWDTDNTNPADRIRIYVNGVKITEFSTDTTPALGLNSFINDNSFTAYVNKYGSISPASTHNGACYLTEINFVDGQGLAPTDFGEFDSNGIWKAKEYTGSYGTNGFHLEFERNNVVADLGFDSSPNENDWTPVNFAITDETKDTPERNYCTLNPIWSSPNLVLTDGNLRAASPGTATDDLGLGTIGVESDKWYFECKIIQRTNFIGVGLSDYKSNVTNAIGTANIWSYTSNAAGPSGSGHFTSNTDAAGPTNTLIPGGVAPQVNDIVQVAFDVDSGEIWFGLNGIWLSAAGAAQANDPATGATPVFSGSGGIAGLGPIFPMIVCPDSGTYEWLLNFGQKPFAFIPPNGFEELKAENLPDPIIPNPGLFFNTNTWSGSNTTNRIGFNFQPDFTWIKNRTNVADHIVQDSVRGLSVFQEVNDISSNEQTTSGGFVAEYLVDGIRIEGADPRVNQTGSEYVGWAWKENIEAGFDIIDASGFVTGVSTNYAHNLGPNPKFAIVKRRDGVGRWAVDHVDFSNAPSIWNNVFLDGSDSVTNTPAADAIASIQGGTIQIRSNAPSGDYIIYVWSEVDGFSKFGSYVGNGNTDGPFVYCGFRPAFVIVKNTTNSSNWNIYDSVRNISNSVNKVLFPNLSNAEQDGTAGNPDFLSNGFKWTTASTDVNTNTDTYIFAAFAEHPFKTTLAKGISVPPSTPITISLINAITTVGLTTNLKLALDAGDSSSYSGSGQDWVDTSGAGNGAEMQRGLTAGADAADPTFNGVSGNLSNNEYWSFDGADFFQYGGAAETWMNSLHQDNAVIGGCAWFFKVSTSSTIALATAIDGGGNIGVYFAPSGIDDKLEFSVRRGTGYALNIISDVVLPTGAWHFIAFSIDEPTGAGGGFLYANGNYLQVGASNTFNATYAGPSGAAANQALAIGKLTATRMPSGSRLASTAVWEGTAPTKTNFDDIYNATKGRFGF